MLEIRCIICDQVISSPKVDCLHCGKAKCKSEYDTNMTELWKLENPDKVSEMNKKSYLKRKESSKPKGL